MGFDWKSIVGTIAPIVGTALGGPFGGMAGKVLGDLLGVEDPTNDEQMEKAVQQALADPNKAMAFKEAEMAFKAKMKELGITEQQLHVEDRKSARSMQEKVRSWAPGALAVVITLGFFGLLSVLCYVSLPIDNEKVLYVMIGSLGTAWTQVMNFYFGSSMGSKAKTDHMANMKR